MKKYIIIPFLLLTIFFDAKAQIEITPFTGYAFDHSFSIAGGSARLGGGQTFGGALSFAFSEFAEVELFYSYQAGTSTANSNRLPEIVDTRTAVHYALIGYNRLIPASEKLVLFAGLKMGTGTLAAIDNDFTNITRFTVGLQGGAKFFASERVGIRVQTNLMIPISNVGANLWWSPGGGTQVGVSGFSSIVQFGFTGGLILRINKD